MELSTAIVPNDRAVIGGNAPPDDPFDVISQMYREQRAAGSAWMTDVPVIETQEQADFAAAFIRQCRDLKKRAEDAFKTERAPLDDAVKACRAKWNTIIDGLPTVLGPVQQRVTAWQIAEDDRIAAERAAARKAAEEAARAAAEEEARAAELARKADAGELAGTGVNVLAAADAAAEARLEAERRATELAAAERAKVAAGGQFTVGGVKKSMTLRTFKTLEWDTEQSPRLSTVVSALVKAGLGKRVQDALLDIARAHARDTKFASVIPGFKIVEEKRSV